MGNSSLTDFKCPGSDLCSSPPIEKWDDWVDYDPAAWPRHVARRYQPIPTICFNCESACGLLAYIDKEAGQVDRFEGNPMHPASHGRLCAKGRAVINQIHDPDRLLYPMKRVGPRGSGQWARTSWDEVLETFGARIRKAILEGRGEEVMYHVGRPGHDFIMEHTLQAWGLMGTIRTPTSAPPPRAWATCSGITPIVRRRTTRTRVSSCFCRPTLNPGTISIPRPNASSTAKWQAPRSR